MDPRFLQYYSRELQHLRDVGGEFAKEFPKIAQRLGLDAFECADPYVERLLEGFAFLTARVQLKIDAEFPRFTQHLMEIVCPNYLAPTPSMTVVQFQPDLTEGGLASGFVIPRDTKLRSLLGKGEQTACEFRTAHEVTLWPLELVQADYLPTTGAVSAAGVTSLQSAKAGIRLRLRATSNLTFDQLALECLSIYLRGGDDLPFRVYEKLAGNSLGLVARSPSSSAPWEELLPKASIRPQGFDDGQGLLPAGGRSFHGYRLLHEYFAFPNRFLFVELAGLGPAVRRCADAELDLIVLLDRCDPSLEQVLDASHFAFFCSPACNLFPRAADRIHLNERETEYHVVPDRVRPMDFEVYQITGVEGFGTTAQKTHTFQPLYALGDYTRGDDKPAYYACSREPRVLSTRQRQQGARSHYLGAEVYVSLVDANEAPYSTDLRQLAVSTLCTNRDLPLHMPVGRSNSDFTLEVGAPVLSIRCVSGPTAPRPAFSEGETAWRIISHLSLNYLSLVDNDEQKGAAALRELLGLYGDRSEMAIRRQIDGVKSIVSKPVLRRLPSPGPITFARGLELTMTCDEMAFEGSGVFLLGAVLNEFFAKYTSINSFTETVVNTLQRGEIMRWAPRTGRRPTL